MEPIVAVIFLTLARLVVPFGMVILVGILYERSRLSMR